MAANSLPLFTFPISKNHLQIYTYPSIYNQESSILIENYLSFNDFHHIYKTYVHIIKLCKNLVLNYMLILDK